MWYLSSEYDNRILYVVPLKNEIIIGRSIDENICNFAIVDDPSISRKHAVLSVKGRDLFVKDLGSRYGTFINNSIETLPADTDTRLNDGDVVKLGKMNSIWKVHENNLTTCTSTLQKSDQQTVISILGKLGGVFKNEWEASCMYLTMPAITLTIKVVLALVQGRHIVTTDFWNKCLDAVNNNTALPDPKNFTPTVAETTLNKEIVSFLPKEERKTIFAGKKFVFFIKSQYDMYKNVLLSSSAEPILFNGGNIPVPSLSDDDIVVIQDNKTYTNLDHKQQVMNAITYLKTKKKRSVPESDIGLAILYCSTEKYCNPNFNVSNEIIKQTNVNKPGNVLAFESQESHNAANKGYNIVLSESLISLDNAIENAGKRKCTEDFDDIETNANKKIATGAPLLAEDSTHKRKLSNDDSASNPSKKLALQDNSENEDIFNFITSKNDASNDKSEAKNQASKKLNLVKPTKRKAEMDDDNDLFNFVDMNKTQKTNDTAENEENINTKTNIIPTTKTGNITAEEITAMRGVKLAELMKNSASGDNVYLKQNIKKEIKDELDEKMSSLDLGTTIVIVRPDLIIKKEPIEIEEPISTVKNFKKFKKVWPVKMSVSSVPKLSMTMTTVGGN